MPDTLQARTPSEAVSTAQVSDLLFIILKGISPAAHAAGRYGVTDREVDVFSAEVCAAVGTEYVKVQTIKQYIERGRQIRTRVLTLYHWACEALCRSPKSFPSPPDCLLESTDIQTVAAEIREDARQRHRANETASWEELCLKKLGAFASLIISGTLVDTSDYNPYAFLHKTITSLTADPSIFELAALVQLIEKETLQLVNVLMAGDTLVEVPSLRPSVRVSKILVIDRSPKPGGGSKETGFRG